MSAPNFRQNLNNSSSLFGKVQDSFIIFFFSPARQLCLCGVKRGVWTERARMGVSVCVVSSIARPVWSLLSVHNAFYIRLSDPAGASPPLHADR